MIFGLFFTRKEVENEKLKLLRDVNEMLRIEKERWPLLLKEQWKERKASKCGWRNEEMEETFYSGMGHGGRQVCQCFIGVVESAIKKRDFYNLKKHSDFMKGQIKAFTQ